MYRVSVDDAMDGLSQKICKLKSQSLPKEIELLIDYMSHWDDAIDFMDDAQDVVNDSNILDQLMFENDQFNKNRTVNFAMYWQWNGHDDWWSSNQASKYCCDEYGVKC